MKKLSIILLGAPGAGKGTQAMKISSKFNLPHISTGDILRNAVKEKTELGVQAKALMDRGALVSDDIISGIVERRLSKDDCRNGFILDGYPRTIAQCEFLARVIEINYAISIHVPENLIVERLSMRRTCESCGTMYHLKFNTSAKSGLCDSCGGHLIHRKDDKEEVIKKRLVVYNANMQPLIDYYTQKGVLNLIDGNRPIDNVFTSISELLGNQENK